jgi:hypothetical protein
MLQLAGRLRQLAGAATTGLSALLEANGYTDADLASDCSTPVLELEMFLQEYPKVAAAVASAESFPALHVTGCVTGCG